MEEMKRVQIPAFGNWDYCDEMPITQYFESAMQAGLIRAPHFYPEEEEEEEEEDLFKVAKPVHHHHIKQVRKSGVAGERKMTREQQLRKHGKVHDLTNQISPRKKQPKAVDEDLYKIPSELLYQKPKKKRLLRNLWSGCLGLNCIA